MLRFSGRLGPGDDTRAKAMAGILGTVEPTLDHPQASVWGTLANDAAVIRPDDGVLRTGVSGAAPLYADLAGPSRHFCSRVEPLAQTAEALTPDWDAWAHIIAAGAPLEGRTSFSEIRRLPPWSRVTADGDLPTVPDPDWPWLHVDESATATVDGIRDGLVDAVGDLTGSSPPISLLSGGWDSRILAALAAVSAPESVTAWTTSSDTGHVLEELVASKVAAELGIAHEIVPPRWDHFGADLEYFTQVVDYQTSFHVWLVPLARRLAGRNGTVLDGLGGGIFVGGAFPDTDHSGSPTEHRFARLTHYLDAADDVLAPGAAAQIRERTRAGFAAVAAPLADHPFAATFTAYLTRTLPGISLAPMGLIANGTPVATPFLADNVVRAALAVPASQHADGRLYPELLRPIGPQLAAMPTAADLAPAHRTHRRRVSSMEAATVVRNLVMREPVRALLAPALAGAELDRWCTLLDRTKSQHLLRGLATLSLWLDHYDAQLTDVSLDPLTMAVG
jgi:hypothetical protein